MLAELHTSPKERKNSRIIVLRPMEGKRAEKTNGVLDPKLFTGDNHLIAKLDPFSNLWTIQYRAGIVPPGLKQRFTGFNALMKYVEQYMNRRNVEIVEVVD